MLVAMAVLCSACLSQNLAGPALMGAQRLAPMSHDQIQWIARPSGRDFSRAYPREALDREEGGVAVLCCSVLDDGALACSTAFEAPTERGFGDAAVQLSRSFRMHASDAALWRASGVQLPLPVTFCLSGSDCLKWNQKMRTGRFDAQAAGMCAASNRQASGYAPSRQDIKTSIA
ncbi:MAG: hypothetical protein GC189_10150 [Alphaproteobacteria bacterium]|nr:hypothetical protein [Alphaproteobacteria bacterium]